MRQSQLFTRTRREAPKDEEAANARLLIRAGFIHKEMAGVFSYLPLGLRVLNNIVRIIREEMDAIGGQEMILSALQDKILWERTDRWDDASVDNWFKTELKTGGETGLAITHEEPLTRIMSEHISSYRDLPVLAYQFQNKFRNELRAKSGIIRGKEFLMKDLYSFARTEGEHRALYNAIRDAYVKIFDRMGIGNITYITSASGGIFSSGFSEEFQTISDAGEDIILVDERQQIAINKEVATEEAVASLGLDRAHLAERKAIEVANIFNLGTKFSEPLGLSYTDESGNKKPVIMGSYGLGPTRLMGTLVEILNDQRGIVWPESIAPYRAHLMVLGGVDSPARTKAEALYLNLQNWGVEVLYDDRDEATAGEKLADADLIGIPWRLVVSERTGDKIEVKRRSEAEAKLVTQEELMQSLKIKA